MVKKSWAELGHDDRIKVLKNNSNQEITGAYEPPEDVSIKEFAKYLQEFREFWHTDSLEEGHEAGQPPNKETLIGARRDLNKTEAILELIDNSIDAWNRRKRKHPAYTAKTLNIYIDLDLEGRTLTYEDNAGGVSKDFHNNLVNPGHSETGMYDRSIGSYRTGGKKAVFKLAEEASILTRYRDPSGLEDAAYSIQLDKAWLENPTAYKFKVYPYRQLEEIELGSTRFSFRLAEDWDQDELGEVKAEVRKTYSLMFVRNPEIKVFIKDREHPLMPLSDLYKFSGAHVAKKIDIRPQRVKFTTTVILRDKEEELSFEIVIGCRTTSAASQGEDRWGIDIYGNDRMFIAHNQQELWDWFSLPKPAPGHLVRAFINIIGPNVLVPWDTHKRHMTTDHETIKLLRSKTIRDLFTRWKDVYATIGSGTEIKDTIRTPMTSWIDSENDDVCVAFDDDVVIPAKVKKPPLSEKIHTPTVVTSKKATTQPIEIKLKFTQAEFRILCGALDVDRPKGDDRTARSNLTEAIKAHLLSL